MLHFIWMNYYFEQKVYQQHDVFTFPLNYFKTSQYLEGKFLKSFSNYLLQHISYKILHGLFMSIMHCI